MPSPNIILFLADQHKWNCTGYAGNRDVRTPNLDALAKHGVNFTQTICQTPQCEPSRATLMTGQYPRAHRVYENGDGLILARATIPKLLQAAGYHTGALGKIHFNPGYANHGFDVMHRAEQSEPGRSNDDYHPWLKDQGAKDDVDHWDQVDRASAPQMYWDHFGAIQSNLSAELHSSTWIGDQAVRFIQAASEPFFLWVSFIKPRHPFDPSDPWHLRYRPNDLRLPESFQAPPLHKPPPSEAFFDLSKLTEKAFRKILAYYYGSISQMDNQIGRILATVSSRLHTNNVILYCSDHGDYMGQHGLILEGGGPPLDSLIRVPLLISGVAGQRAGNEEQALAELTDIAPTVLDVADVPVPKTVQGKSLVPQLMKPRVPLRAAAYCRTAAGLRVVRTREHKLVQGPGERQWAFFDLANDPDELVNRAGQPETAAKQAQLTNFLRKHR